MWVAFKILLLKFGTFTFLSILPQQGFCETAIEICFCISSAHLHSPWIWYYGGYRNRSSLIYLLSLHFSHHVHACHLISMGATTNGNPGHWRESGVLHLLAGTKSKIVRCLKLLLYSALPSHEAQAYTREGTNTWVCPNLLKCNEQVIHKPDTTVTGCWNKVQADGQKLRLKCFSLLLELSLNDCRRLPEHIKLPLTIYSSVPSTGATCQRKS